MLYEIHFKRDGGETYAIETLEAIDDSSVIEASRRLFQSQMGAGYEIWDGGRLVHSEFNGQA